MPPPDFLPFNRPTLAGDEFAHIRDAIARGQLAGDGHFTEQCQHWLAERSGARAALLTHSCTAALEMAAILTGIGPGDEVIMPSYTFVSTANAVALRGGTPVFVDIRPDTLNIDETLIADAITPRTRAIWPVHYAGIIAEMDPIMALAERHGLSVVEDAAQAFGSTYRGRPAGSIGDLAAFSFHETKNIISGEGGALLMRDETYIERAEIIREKGTNRKRFFRGQVDKYTWVDIGSSYLPGELIAAFLYGQLEQAERIQAERLANWRRYDAALRPLGNLGITLPTIPAHCSHNAHLYYMMMPDLASRTEVIARLRQEDGIVAPFHYVPLHDAPAGQRLGRSVGDMRHTLAAGQRLLRLPLFPGIGEGVDRVIEALTRHLRRVLG